MEKNERIEEIRERMGEIFDIKPFKGIENEDEHAIDYQLDDWAIDEIQELKEELKQIKEQIIKRIDEIRKRMGEILDVEPFEGIENEDEHAIDYQLDDWAIDEMQELREELNGLKEIDKPEKTKTGPVNPKQETQYGKRPGGEGPGGEGPGGEGPGGEGPGGEGPGGEGPGGEGPGGEGPGGEGPGGEGPGGEGPGTGGTVDYNKMLAEYKKLLQQYKGDLEKLYGLQKQYEDGEIEYSEYQEYADYISGKYDHVLEEYKKVLEEYNKQNKDKTNHEKNTNGKWHPDLTQEQIDYIKSELDIYEPEGQEYEQALKQLGLDPNKQSEKEDEKPKWHPDLTPEQIDDAIQRDIYEPVGQEYEQFLMEHGIDPNKNKGEQENSLEKPEEPEEPRIIDEKEKDGPEEQKALVKSGLQIFREQFNQMPDIKDRHTLSERIKIFAPIGITIGALTLSTPVIGIPVIAASALAKPIAYRLTGQKKLEKQIQEQFSKMSAEELDRMVDYLSEEKIQELKPNAVILNALHKTMLEKTQKKSQELQNEKNTLEQDRESLLEELETADLTPEEDKKKRKELGVINDRLGVIDTQEAPKVERQLKDIKRGKDRVSAAYKGNLATRFNIFAKRNSTTEEYSDAINEYADAELERDTAKLDGDSVKEAQGQIKMDKVMQENTHKNFLGIQRSVFNGRNSAVKIVSDQKDNTVRTTCTGIMIGYGLYKTVEKMNEFEAAQAKNEQEFNQLQSNHNRTVNDMQTEASKIDQGTVQEVADGEVTNAAAQAEHAIVHEHGVTTSAAYRADDAAAQLDIQNVANQSTISANNPADRVRQLSDVVKAREGIAADYGQSSTNLHLSPNAADHTAQVGYTSNAEGQAKATVSFLDKVANILDKVQNMATNSATFQKVQKSFIGPIIAGVGAISHGAQEMAENKKEKKHNEAVKISDTSEKEADDGQEIG